MNDQTQKFRIGLFVLGGVAVLLAMLFFFGLSNLFTHRAKVQSFFSESVQGLTVGSAVKYPDCNPRFGQARPGRHGG